MLYSGFFFEPSLPPAETLAAVETGEQGRLMEGARRGKVGGEGLAVSLNEDFEY